MENRRAFYGPKTGLFCTRFLLLHTVAPIMVGASIYILWRKPTLLVFSWLAKVGLDGFVSSCRNAVAGVSLPKPLLFGLPDGLWLYAFTAFMGGLWVDELNAFPNCCWAYLGLVLAIGGEMGQFCGWVEGTFDLIDLVFYVTGFLLAICVTRNATKRRQPWNVQTHAESRHRPPLS